jgi:hypothetical protein
MSLCTSAIGLFRRHVWGTCAAINTPINRTLKVFLPYLLITKPVHHLGTPNFTALKSARDPRPCVCVYIMLCAFAMRGSGIPYPQLWPPKEILECPH